MRTSIPEEEYALLLNALRAERESRAVTQVELAVRMGVDQNFISKCERGGRRLDVLEFRKWCMALGTTIVDVLARVEVQLSEFEDARETTRTAQKKLAHKPKAAK